MVLDCAGATGFTPQKRLVAGPLRCREVLRRSDRKLREARAADAVGSKGGTERRRSLEEKGEAERLALRVSKRAHLDN